jgi:rSAM/selenodomain-associated transferase 2
MYGWIPKLQENRMPAPVSVVIPTLNTATTFGPCLASVFEGVQAGLVREVIFADGGSDDGIAQVAEDAGAVLITTQSGRGVQLASGAKVAKGDWLLFLHADTVLEAGWPAVFSRHLVHPQKAGYCRLVFDAPGIAARIVAGWANWRSRWLGLPYGDQALLISAELYRECGGYPPIPLMEDVALARALGNRLTALPATATTNATRYLRQGWVNRGGHNLITLALYFLGRDPNALAQRYRRQK